MLLITFSRPSAVIAPSGKIGRLICFVVCTVGNRPLLRPTESAFPLLHPIRPAADQ